MHFINRRTWKSSQHYIIIVVMASFMRVPFMLVFYQSNCVSASKRILFYYGHVCILVFFHVLLCSLLMGYACLSLVRCVWEWRHYTIQLNNNDRQCHLFVGWHEVNFGKKMEKVTLVCVMQAWEICGPLEHLLWPSRASEFSVPKLEYNIASHWSSMISKFLDCKPDASIPHS